MVGGLEAGRRVAAAALLALGSMVPHDGPLLAAPAQIAPVADTGVACPLTVGTATTDPALANDAARAIAVGYAVTDCMPDAELLAAAEARALIPMGTPAAMRGLGHRRDLLAASSAPPPARPRGRRRTARPRSPRRPPRARRRPPRPPRRTPRRRTPPPRPARPPARRPARTSSDDGSSIGSSDNGSDSGSTGRRHRTTRSTSGANSGVTDDGSRHRHDSDDRRHRRTDDGTRPPTPDHRGHRDGGRHVRLGHPHGRRGLRRRHCRTGVSTTVRATPATAAAPRPR